VLDAARLDADVVVVDLAAPVEEDEELSFDRAPFRRNLMTRIALADAAAVLMVVGADPIGLRRAVFAQRHLRDELPSVVDRVGVVLNRMPSSARRRQELSVEVEQWLGAAPVALLPVEPGLDHVSWSGTPLHELVPRSLWLRELRSLAHELVVRA
jgi:Flp pilus assembly CpaE family ATPase